jgi:phosphate transport system substrate-binding protein
MKLKSKSRVILTSLLAVMAFGVVSCSSGKNVSKVNGAGASFPYPLYSKMFHEYYKKKNIQVNYQSIGSGGGIRQLKNETVDFGASDAYLSDKSLEEFGRDVLHVPTCLGAVVLSYNLEGVESLNLTGDLIADIYLGKVKKWNDRRIKALNPSTKLPDLDIIPANRSDGSGTTFIFTDYLSKVSDAWLSKVGRGKAVNWPKGLGGKGNAGVAGIVQNTPGAIGYIGLIYANQNKMPVAAVKNQKGSFIVPSLESISNAANTTLPEDTRVSITDTTAEKGYPISGFTWVLLIKEQNYKSRTMAQAVATKELVKWMITDGQEYTRPLLYAPLPKSAQKKALEILKQVSYNGKTL